MQQLSSEAQAAHKAKSKEEQIKAQQEAATKQENIEFSRQQDIATGRIRTQQQRIELQEGIVIGTSVGGGVQQTEANRAAEARAQESRKQVVREAASQQQVEHRQRVIEKERGQVIRENIQAQKREAQMAASEYNWRKAGAYQVSAKDIEPGALPEQQRQQILKVIAETDPSIKQRHPSLFIEYRPEQVATEPVVHSEYTIDLVEPRPTNVLLELTEGGTQRIVTQDETREFYKQQALSLKSFIKEAKEQGRTHLTITVDGVTRTIPIDQARREFTTALRTDPSATLSAPTMISLSETIDVDTGEMGLTGIQQSMEGLVSSVVERRKTTEPTYNLGQGFTPLSVKGTDVMGFATIEGKPTLVSLEFPSIQLGQTDTALDIFTRGVEQAAERATKTGVVGSMFGEMGKEVAALFSLGVGYERTGQYELEKLRGEKLPPPIQPYVPVTGSALLVKPLIVSAQEIIPTEGNVTKQTKAIMPDFQEAKSYFEKHGVGAIVGAGISLAVPIGGGKLSPLKIKKLPLEAVPEAGLSSAKYVVTYSVKGKPFIQEFKTFDEATKFQKSIPPNVVTDIKFSAIQTPVQTLKFGYGKLSIPVVTKQEGRYKIGGPTPTAQTFEKLSPTGRGFEMTTQTEFAREITTSEKGLESLVQAGKILPEDVPLIKAGFRAVELLDIAERKFASEVTRVRGTFQKMPSTSLTAKESPKFVEQVLPKSEAIKGATVLRTQVREELQPLGGLETSDIDVDYASKIMGTRRAEKFTKQAVKTMTPVMEEGRGIIKKGTKVYTGPKGQETAKLIEALTKKDVSYGPSELLAKETGKIAGKPVLRKTVEVPTEGGKKIKEISKESQAKRMLEDLLSIQGPRTEDIAKEIKPDYLKRDATIKTTIEGFRVGTPAFRLKTPARLPMVLEDVARDFERFGYPKLATEMREITKVIRKRFGQEIEFVEPTSKVSIAEIEGVEQIPTTTSKVVSSVKTSAKGVPGTALLVVRQPPKEETPSELKVTVKPTQKLYSPTTSKMAQKSKTSSLISATTSSRLSASSVIKQSVGSRASVSRAASRTVLSSKPSTIKYQTSKIIPTKSSTSVTQMVGSQASITKLTSKTTPSTATPSVVSTSAPSVLKPIPFIVERLPDILRPSKKPKLIGGLVLTRTRKEKGRKKELGGKTEFIGSTRVADVLGFRTKKTDITYGAKSPAIALKDIRKSGKGTFTKSRKTRTLSKPQRFFTPTKKQEKKFLTQARSGKIRL